MKAVRLKSSGYLHQVMCRTRADFKLALHQCKVAEEQSKLMQKPENWHVNKIPEVFGTVSVETVARRFMVRPMLIRWVMPWVQIMCVRCGRVRSPACITQLMEIEQRKNSSVKSSVALAQVINIAVLR